MITSGDKTFQITPNHKKKITTFQELYENFSLKFMFDAIFLILPN